MRKAFRILQTVMWAIWSTGILQAATRQFLHWLWLLVRWCAAHPGSIPGGLLALWLAKLFDTPMTRTLMNFAGIPMLVYYGIIVGLGAAMGGGIITFKRPFDDLR